MSELVAIVALVTLAVLGVVAIVHGLRPRMKATPTSLSFEAQPAAVPLPTGGPTTPAQTTEAQRKPAARGRRPKK